jgi:hypothetical protein
METKNVALAHDTDSITRQGLASAPKPAADWVAHPGMAGARLMHVPGEPLREVWSNNPLERLHRDLRRRAAGVGAKEL